MVERNHRYDHDEAADQRRKTSSSLRTTILERGRPSDRMTRCASQRSATRGRTHYQVPHSERRRPSIASHQLPELALPPPPPAPAAHVFGHVCAMQSMTAWKSGIEPGFSAAHASKLLLAVTTLEANGPLRARRIGLMPGMQKNKTYRWPHLMATFARRRRVAETEDVAVAWDAVVRVSTASAFTHGAAEAGVIQVAVASVTIVAVGAIGAVDGTSRGGGTATACRHGERNHRHDHDEAGDQRRKTSHHYVPPF